MVLVVRLAAVRSVSAAAAAACVVLLGFWVLVMAVGIPAAAVVVVCSSFRVMVVGIAVGRGSSSAVRVVVVGDVGVLSAVCCCFRVVVVRVVRRSGRVSLRAVVGAAVMKGDWGWGRDGEDSETVVVC